MKHTASRDEFMLPVDNGTPAPPWMPAKFGELFPLSVDHSGEHTVIGMNDAAWPLSDRLRERYGTPDLTFAWGPGEFESADDAIEYAPSTKAGVVFIRKRTQ